ncbi:hypothetical protein LTR56_001673 [Elasticomyces elasticus]|nr:hypothetical protein LTR56_001673 [Elasticomyces elasticus]KAK3667276.1 hypothetical protein LTR22_001792 [Elasticomyces elasticus]KAK4932646.1 hypothetical protein LTR49_001070 [Elasticomyces elasticus]KAK5769667.1 hypothetical protein LTS12_000117 [Elasticomyces elasticus]
MSAIMRGHLLLAVRSPSITTAVPGQGVKVGFVSTPRIATRKLSLWPFTRTPGQASTKENSTPIKATTKDDIIHRLRVEPETSTPVPKEYTIKIDLFDDKPAQELVYRDDQGEYGVVLKFMARHGLWDPIDDYAMNARSEGIANAVVKMIQEQTGGKVKVPASEVIIETLEQDTRAESTNGCTEITADPNVVSALSLDQPSRFHAEGVVTFSSIVVGQTGQTLRESICARLCIVLRPLGHFSQHRLAIVDISSLPTGFMNLELISFSGPDYRRQYTGVSFTCINVSEIETARIKQELEGMPRMSGVKIGPVYSNAGLRDMDRQKRERELMYRDDHQAQEPHYHHDIMLDGKASSISALTIGIGASIMLCLWAYGSATAHEKHHDHLIVLEKGLDDSHVADAKREINIIVNEGRIHAKSVVEEYFALSHHIFWARLQPAQTHIIEKIRALKDVKSVTACKKADSADIEARPVIDRDDQSAPEAYLRYDIMLEKGLNDSQVANVECEINKIVDEERGGDVQGTASMSAIEGRIQHTYVILLARLRPDQTRVLERIRGLTEVRFVEASQKISLAKIPQSLA